MKHNDKNKAALIQYRIEQANNTIETVKLLIENDKYNAAINRIYYGMFYILLAIAVKTGFETSKHQQLIGWFNKTFIKEDILPKRFGKTISQVFKSRQISDYEAFVEFEKKEVLQLFEDMKDFIKTLEEYLKNN
ncbi:MAG: hypothetical protein B6I19_09650 [Bacteroidetes bacterium 4572_114]|nr:MAG: hypothetical protein B6I19_09650 [Bacteroidetes bacterium 4572_114]